MFRFAAGDAGKRTTNASKAIPAGQSQSPQAEWKELLVCPVEGGRKTKIERNRALLEDDANSSRRYPDGDPSAGERRGGESREDHLDVREVLRGRVSSGLSSEVEGFNRHG